MKTISCFFFLIAWMYNGYAQTKLDTAELKRVSSLKPAFYLLPAACITYGFLAQNKGIINRADKIIDDDLGEDYPTFKTHIDDGLQYVPAISVYALNFLGVHGKNNIRDQTAIYLISNAFMGLSVNVLKVQTHKLRPDGSDYHSFPSGHTATAFVAAEFMNQEYKDTSPLYGVAAYTLATATGSLRMLNNKHWLSDVVTGAGIGMLSTKITYLVYPFLKREIYGKLSSKLMLIPVYQGGLWGFTVAANFN